MRLSDGEAKQFYFLYFSLLDFVNEKYHIADMPKMAGQGSSDIMGSYEVAKRLWKELSLIDDFIVHHPELNAEDKGILMSWKKRILGPFVVERILKEGAIIFSANSDVYLVRGILTTWEEYRSVFTLPAMMDTVLIPYKDRIIYAGLMVPYSVTLSDEICRHYKNAYEEAKAAGTIRKTL